MPSFSQSTLNLFQRFFRSPNPPSEGTKTVLDGNTAVSATEACIAEAAGLGSSFPANAATFAWQHEQQRRGKNCFGKNLTGRDTEGARGTLAATIGLGMSGARVTTFLSSPDLMSAQDLLLTVVGRHIPLVLHLSNRTQAAHAGALGSGHEAYHASADSGFFVLHATTVQEAVDFSLVARRVAELTLIPGLVAMDGEQTALAAQEVELPNPDLVRSFLGDPNDQIAAPTTAQKLLFGETRRRVPRWHDPDRPVMHGAVQGPESWALGAVAKHPYFNHHLGAILEESLAQLSAKTGRVLNPVSNYRTDDAQIVLVAQGAAIETLKAVADHLRGKIKVGVLGIHCFRPFPGAQIAKHLNKKTVVAVLERVDTPLAVDPPLMRQVRATLERALENGRLGSEVHPGYPLIKDQQLPRFRSVVYGLGGQPLRASDLIALCENLEAKGQGRIFLGIEFARTSSIYPKRQVLLDNLRRYYPDIANLGLRSQKPAPDLRPKDALTVAIHNLGYHSKGLSVEAASLLHRLVGGCLRSRPGLLQDRWLAGWVDTFTHAATPLLDVGDDLPVDIAVLTAPHRKTKPLDGLHKGSVLLMVSNQDDDTKLWQSLAPSVQEDIRAKQAQLYYVSVPETNSKFAITLGSLFGTLLETGRLDVKARRILTSYEDTLHHLSAVEHQARLEDFTAGFEGVRQLDYLNLQATHDSQLTIHNSQLDEAPMAVRHLGKSGGAYDSLPRFWDQVGVLYRNDKTAELTPDPYMATGTIPPLTSTFRDLSQAREILPAFEPSLCTGCGQCWSHCPDSAIGSIVISPTALIDAGIRMAGADALRMVSSKIVSKLHSLGRNSASTQNTAGEFIQTAFSGIKDKLPIDRKTAIVEAVESINQHIGSLPIACTDAFFADPEHYQHETGELLSLVINPDACKACKLCIAACEVGALTEAPQTPQRVTQAKNLWRLWEQLPDTAGTTIERAGNHEKVGKMPAILLSRYCQAAIGGGDEAEAGSGEKMAVRLALAVTEFQRQPFINSFLADITEVRAKLLEKIRVTLTNALPTNDLDALAKGLDAIHPSQAPLSALTKQLENAAEQELVDAAQLRRLVKTTQALGDLQWQLAEGGHGLGRSRLSLAIAPGTLTNWAGSWPNNPFQVPVAIDMSGDTAQLAGGLLEGQLQVATNGVALLRQAKLELEKPEEAARAAQTFEPPNWRDLTKEEQRFCPPLLLIGNALEGKGFTAIAHLLGGDLPLKILILADLDLDFETVNVAGSFMAAAKGTQIELGLLALSQRSAYIAQTSIADTSHFLASVKAAFEFAGPALIHVHAPSPERHGFASNQTFTQASLALQARVLPLFSYNPASEGVFGSRINLEGNPNVNAAWGTVGDDIITPADWAVREQRFASYFTLLNDDSLAPLPIAEYLELKPAARRGKTPIVTVIKEADETVRLQVQPELVAVCEECLHGWQTLQELAGLVTPFTADVKARLQSELTYNHQADLAELKQEYEAKIANLRAEMEAEMKARVKSQLMTLAGYTN